jgi:hypothetical protein
VPGNQLDLDSGTYEGGRRRLSSRTLLRRTLVMMCTKNMLLQNLLIQRPALGYINPKPKRIVTEIGLYGSCKSQSGARELHSHLKWQRDQTIPRTSFPGGITTLTKMQGNKRTRVLLLLLLIFILEYWSNWRNPGSERIHVWIRARSLY